MTLINKDTVCGAIFILIGVAFGGQAYLKLSMGTVRNMGPGYFPMVLSALLIGFGLIVAAWGLRSSASGSLSLPSIRAIALVLGGPILFSVLIEPLGMVPSIAILALIVSFASRSNSLRSAALIAIAMACFCVLLFRVALGMPLALLGTWFT
jgi:hypothetical protein